jgi:hypothetical protein
VPPPKRAKGAAPQRQPGLLAVLLPEKVSGTDVSAHLALHLSGGDGDGGGGRGGSRELTAVPPPLAASEQEQEEQRSAVGAKRRRAAAEQGSKGPAAEAAQEPQPQLGWGQQRPPPPPQAPPPKRQRGQQPQLPGAPQLGLPLANLPQQTPLLPPQPPAAAAPGMAGAPGLLGAAPWPGAARAGAGAAAGYGRFLLGGGRLLAEDPALLEQPGAATPSGAAATRHAGGVPSTAAEGAAVQVTPPVAASGGAGRGAHGKAAAAASSSPGAGTSLPHPVIQAGAPAAGDIFDQLCGLAGGSDGKSGGASGGSGGGAHAAALDASRRQPSARPGSGPPASSLSRLLGSSLLNPGGMAPEQPQQQPLRAALTAIQPPALQPHMQGPQQPGSLASWGAHNRVTGGGGVSSLFDRPAAQRAPAGSAGALSLFSAAVGVAVPGAEAPSPDRAPLAACGLGAEPEEAPLQPAPAPAAAAGGNRRGRLAAALAQLPRAGLEPPPPGTFGALQRAPALLPGTPASVPRGPSAAAAPQLQPGGLLDLQRFAFAKPGEPRMVPQGPSIARSGLFAHPPRLQPTRPQLPRQAPPPPPQRPAAAPNWSGFVGDDDDENEPPSRLGAAGGAFKAAPAFLPYASLQQLLPQRPQPLLSRQAAPARGAEGSAAAPGLAPVADPAPVLQPSAAAAVGGDGGGGGGAAAAPAAPAAEWNLDSVFSFLM